MQPYSFTADGERDPIIIPKDLAEFLIQRQRDAVADNKEFERLQTAERHLKEIREIIDAHEIQVEDCDRRGHLHCDCLERKMKQVRAFFGSDSLNAKPWPVKQL